MSRSNFNFDTDGILILPIDFGNKYFYNSNSTTGNNNITVEIYTLSYDNSNVNKKNDNFINRKENNNDWDVLIFSQQWPVTTCYKWRKDDYKRACILPKEKDLWTIHGIWPTKFGTFGPTFCDKDAKFDSNEILKIQDKLNKYWPDIYKEDNINSTNPLWKHEWLKHGTCAKIIKQLNNEYNYFQQALDWRQKIQISTILNTSLIYPNSNNTILAIYLAVHNSLGINPSIHCFYDKIHNIYYIEEIRICLNKNLTFVDCDGVKGDDLKIIKNFNNTIITNCSPGSPIYYPNYLPPLWK